MAWIRRTVEGESVRFVPSFVLAQELGVEGVDVGAGELLQGERPQGRDDVALHVALVGEEGGGPDGGADGR